ncbi:MAG: hypothetical protein LBQ05_02600 [Christensenellaceae bacterium]|jgi:hypothetical protein|nr:hypothetical protein [Christensenellaceae bacterium]
MENKKSFFSAGNVTVKPNQIEMGTEDDVLYYGSGGYGSTGVFADRNAEFEIVPTYHGGDPAGVFADRNAEFEIFPAQK